MEILKKLGVVLLFLLAQKVEAQISFYHVFSGNGYDRAEGVLQLPDSSYLITGTSSSFENAPSQAFLLKLDKNGFHQWSKSYGGAESETGRRVFYVPNYGYYIVGTSSSNGNAFDGYVVFTDVSGNQIWEQWYDNGAWERFNDALLLNDTSLVLIGETTNNPTQQPDHFMLRVDKLGTILWSQHTGGDGDDVLQKGVKTSDSTFVVVGSKYVADSMKSKAFIATYNINGSLIWDTITGTDGVYLLNDIQYYNNELWCVGENTKSGLSDKDEYFIKLQENGQFLVEKDFHYAYDKRYVGFVNYTAPPGDNFFVVSQEYDPNYSYPIGEDFVVSRFVNLFYWDGYGAGYCSIDQDQVNHIIQTNDGYAVLVGFHSYEMLSTGGSSLFIVKLGNDNNFPPDSDNPTIYSILEVEENKLNSSISVYPNPFKSELNIQTDKQLKKIEVIDLTGKLIVEIANPTSVLSLPDMEEGTYILRIETTDSVEVRKLQKRNF